MNSDKSVTPNTSLRKGSPLKLLAHLGAVAVVTAWGTSFISSAVLMKEGGLTPIELFVYRFACAYILLLIITCRKRLLAKSWRDELAFFVSGICACTIYFITENIALLHTTAGNVSLLSAISPLFTTLLMALVYKVRITSGVLAGSIVAFIGVGLVVFSSGEGLEIHPLGDLLALSSAMSWALYCIVVKRLTPLYNSFFITRKIFFYGVLTALPILLCQKEPLHLHILFDLSQSQYLVNFLFLVLMCSVAAYLIWNEAMKMLGSVTANNYLYGQPIVTMVFAAILFHDPVTAMGISGCALIIAGLVLSDKMPVLHLPGRK